MAEKTITKTETRIVEYNFQIDGIGEIIKIPRNLPVPPDDNSSDGSIKTKYTKYEHTDVYIKPNDGVTISKYTQFTETRGNETGTDLDPDHWYTVDYADKYVSKPIFDCAISDQEFGLIYIGEEKIETKVSTIITNWPSAKDITTNEKITYSIDFDTGNSSNIQLTVYGTNIEHEKNRFFTVIGDDGISTTYIFKYSGDKTHSYTNLVVHDQEFNTVYYSSTSVLHIYDGIITETISCYQLQPKGDNSAYPEIDYHSGCDANGLFLRIVNHPTNTQISNVLLYIDSAIIIMSPNINNEDARPYHFDNVLNNNDIEKFNNKIEKCLRVCSMNSDGELGISRVQYIKLMPLMNNCNHKWVEWIPGVSDNTVIQYVDENNKKKINDVVRVISPYIRYTRYWACYDVNRVSILENKIVEETYEMPFNRNQVFRPIFKPFAEAHLICHAAGQKPRENWRHPDIPEYEPFGQDMLSSWWYRTLVKPMRRTFEDDNGQITEYAKEIICSAHDGWKSTNKNMFEYFFRIVSPFKNEYYFVHGSRLQFDQKTWDSKTSEQQNLIKITGEGMGNSRFCVSTKKDDRRYIGTFSINLYHQVNNLYNPYCCIGFYDDSCFGQGIQSGIQKAGDISGIHVSASNLPLCTPNVFFKFNACATHVGFGSSLNGESQDSVLTEYALRNSDTYQKFSDTFNNILMQTTKKQYVEIYKFCVNNFDRLMNYWLKSGIPIRKRILKKTYQEVLRDILNNGERYFCVKETDIKEIKQGEIVIDWTPPDPASDQRFPTIKIDGKDYNPPICDTFIGWLKYNLFGYSHIPKDYYKNPFTEQVSTYLPDYAEQIYNKFKGDSPSSSVYTLRQKLQSISVPIPGYGYRLSNLCCKPWTGCYGMFTGPDVRKFTNPNKYVNSWLTSDKDIKYLCEQTKVKNYDDIDMDAYKKYIDEHFRQHN